MITVHSPKLEGTKQRNGAVANYHDSEESKRTAVSIICFLIKNILMKSNENHKTNHTRKA